MGSANIDTAARKFYGPGFNAYLNLMRMSVPLAALSKASLILCVGLDTRFGRSVVGVKLRKAVGRGAKIITINPRNNNLTMIAEKWLQPVPDEMVHLLRSLVKLTEKKDKRVMRSASGRKRGDLVDELSQVAEMLGEASAPVILVGSEFLQRRESPQILEAIGKLARNTCAGVLPLPAQSNLYGSVLMGAYPELLPGGFSSADKGRADDFSEKWSAEIPTFSSRWSAETLLWKRKMKVLYLIGVVPPKCELLSDFTIFQNIYPPGSSGQTDLVLPAAAFTETDGTSINGEGRVQRVRKAVHPPGEALPDWEILCRIARKLGKKGFDFGNVRQIHKEISHCVAGFASFAKPKRKANPLLIEGEMRVMISHCVAGFASFAKPKRKANPLLIEGEMRVIRRKSAGKKRADKKLPFMMNVSSIEHIYRGFPITDWVEGARMLFAEATVDVSPEDAKKVGISTGDEVVISSEHFQKSMSARIVSGQQRGMLYATLRDGEFIEPNPHPVRMRKKDV
jgi:predicted molibdopterin-dependent oxidoreductase YjgC